MEIAHRMGERSFLERSIGSHLPPKIHCPLSQEVFTTPTRCQGVLFNSRSRSHMLVNLEAAGLLEPQPCTGWVGAPPVAWGTLPNYAGCPPTVPFPAVSRVIKRTTLEPGDLVSQPDSQHWSNTGPPEPSSSSAEWEQLTRHL